MTLSERLSTRTKQRLILASREVDRSIRQTDDMIRAEADDLRVPGATIPELATGLLFMVGQRALKYPVALIAGCEEFLRRGRKSGLFR